MSYWTKDLVIDPNDATQNTWYVGVFSGWGGAPNGLGGLYRTTNRGVSWARLNSLDRVTSCAINPLNANELYLTTETQGLWGSTNITAGSPSFFQVASYPFRQPERIFFNPYKQSEMWVTSFGNGIKGGDHGVGGEFVAGDVEGGCFEFEAEWKRKLHVTAGNTWGGICDLGINEPDELGFIGDE